MKLNYIDFNIGGRFNPAIGCDAELVVFNKLWVLVDIYIQQINRPIRMKI